MKKLFVLLVLLAATTTSNATVPEFSLHVKLFINSDSARTVIFGYDPSASDSMIYGKEIWFSNEFPGGEQLYPPAQAGDLDFRMSGFYIDRPELGIEGSDGGPIDIRKKPTLDSFTLAYGIEFHPVPGTTNARMDWNPQDIPAIIKHITLASYHFPHSIRLDMVNTSSFVFPLADSGEDLYSNMILTLYYNQVDLEVAAVHQTNISSEDVVVYPNPMDTRLNLRFMLMENSRVTLSVYDVTGKKVLERTINGFAGENDVDLLRNDLSSHAGVYLIRLSGVEGSNSFERSATIVVR